MVSIQTPVQPPVASSQTPVQPPVANDPTPVQLPIVRKPLNDLQIGLNFIRFYWSGFTEELDMSTPYVQPEVIFDDFRQLGVHSYRQFVKADLFWNVVEPQDNQWNFAQADAVLSNPDFEPIVTLFRMQYASPTPPWATTPEEFQNEMGPEATDYLTTVVRRYAPFVRYWEIGNEMVYWRAADPGSQQSNLVGEEKTPPSHPLDGYSPQEQGVFLAQAAQIIRQNDPDAVIVMPGLPSLDDYSVNTWLGGVLETGGKDWFDVVNYHYYGAWQPHTRLRLQFQKALQGYGIADRPVWNTETGITSNPNLTIRTDYPNSPREQAAEVFRRIVQAWGLGDQMVMWHTYISTGDKQGNWSAYGVLTERGEQKLAYHAFKLLTSELLPYKQVTAISSDARSQNVYQITTRAEGVRFVAWGKGSFKVPQGVTQMTPVIPPEGGGYVWQAVQTGQDVPLSPEPILLK